MEERARTDCFESRRDIFALSWGRIGGEEGRLLKQSAWIQILALPLESCVTLNKLLDLAEGFSFYSMGRLVPISQGYCEDKMNYEM